MGLLLAPFRFIQDKLLGAYFLIRTGMRRKTVRSICRHLSNLYLTPGSPGKVQTPFGEVEIVTSLPQMKINMNGTYWFDRTDLAIALSWEEKIPLWDARAESLLKLFKYFRDKGILIPPNNDGVRYFHMEGEEAFNA